MISGVYRIKNLVNNKGYVGSTVDFRTRWNDHKFDLRRGKHHSNHLQNARNKYGEEAFVFEILELCEPTLEKLLPLEQIWLDSLCSYLPEYGYNVCKIAGSSLGMKHSEETKRRMSEIQQLSPNNAKLTRAQASEIRQKYLSGKYTHISLAKEFGVTECSVSAIINNKHWRDKTLSEEYFEVVSRLVKHARGKNGSCTKLTWFQACEIRRKYLSGEYKQLDLVKEFGVNQGNIGAIVNNKIWKDETLSDEYCERVSQIVKKHRLRTRKGNNAQ